ncbi:sugar phosphate isomerase [Nitrosomonas sp. HPC101]|uniref:metabolite traffic protein EboE n=1 Tax=Nitrosomonas sp. HPC101 TaxID=1658667 RepID=UPI00136D30C6|nr:metabolite traffic protein EboE [Nitrosomonas sp. HPC101]MXS85799.1 sugar phosphate isomerase [Nitrosomonas sp. HPC101]
MKIYRGEELTYCTNIHPGESWSEIRQNLDRYVLPVKVSVASDEKFGIGLRLSAKAAAELMVPERLCEFKSWLAANDCYVFTINGFPYGSFHGLQVKENVYLPDWSSRLRVDYTVLLSELLAELLPENDVRYGSISTVPVGFRRHISSDKIIESAVSNLMSVVKHLINLEYRTGKRILLALEPEPCCFLETMSETVDFFNQKIFAGSGVKQISESLKIDYTDAVSEIRKYIGICLDLCHAAVEFEDAENLVKQIRSSGILIPKMQISSGLCIASVNNKEIQQLLEFNDGVYLHQIVEKIDQNLYRYEDIEEAVSQYYSDSSRGHLRDREWRIHFHVPVFLDSMSLFHTSQSFLKSILAEHSANSLTQHLEVETYTWGILPERFRSESIVRLITRELTWVKDQLQP